MIIAREVLSYYARSTVFFMSLMLMGCDGSSEDVYNCNGFSVFFGDSFETEFKEYSYFHTFVGGHQAINDKYKYPDGSVHDPIVISDLRGYQEKRQIDLEKYRNSPEQFCRILGPGVVITY